MKIGLVINRNHPNHNIFLAFLSQISVVNNDIDIEIASYDSCDDIPKLVRKDCVYTVILDRYCYIDLPKLQELLHQHQPNIACLSKHNGYGYPYVFIYKTQLIKSLHLHNTTIDSYIDLVLGTQKNKLDKILLLDKFCYLANVNYITGLFHKSIFVGLSDMDSDFGNTMSMLSSGQKNVFYKNKHYVLKLGKSFFIHKYWTFGILPKNTIIVWSAVKNEWILANRKQQRILQQILHKSKINYNKDILI